MDRSVELEERARFASSPEENAYAIVVRVETVSSRRNAVFYEDTDEAEARARAEGLEGSTPDMARGV